MDWALRDQPDPLHLLFVGDARTGSDGTGDPEVVFLGAQLVRSIAEVLVKTSRESFLAPLSAGDIDRSPHIWLLDPMRSFFSAAACREKAIVVLWGD
jgi:hypothetical protein